MGQVICLTFHRGLSFVEPLNLFVQVGNCSASREVVLTLLCTLHLNEVMNAEILNGELNVYHDE
jgi:hypothetical protein